jgi:hypothetical protein
LIPGSTFDIKEMPESHDRLPNINTWFIPSAWPKCYCHFDTYLCQFTHNFQFYYLLSFILRFWFKWRNSRCRLDKEINKILRTVHGNLWNISWHLTQFNSIHAKLRYFSLKIIEKNMTV